jgi:hypothetical protein
MTFRCANRYACRLFAIFFLFISLALTALSQSSQPDEAAIVRGVDAAVKTRFDAIAQYSVIEHYSVFRYSEKTPSAEMTVRTLYQRDAGKSYTIIAESGSDLIRKFVLESILENERRINQPGTRESAWITSANYEMKLKTGSMQQLEGHDCFVLSITPHQKAPNLIVGTIWVDAHDQSIVQIQGTASKSVSHFTGPTQVLRKYDKATGFSMATIARASSSSFLLGPTVVTIDYRDYQLESSLPH